ncbi:Gfo/Idh/MocA family protein [Mucilaginibacter segetis]|uniref:Gfo/Idh/MocA family oxidoreductase n=1 Tax=Mucilaginibacter segetis TaxID=2793071 RepID=A0A934UP73_9SPHI|nr:Gfo/Idh/MocA family oxidoreductase [Mucilaginibacter segetis]MBK0380692.1 Gfo/Idh/MocA family oxidoreductase [Mucilaginibacter segetis]
MNYKIGIIGYGVMGKTRRTAIEEIKKGTVVAISEPNVGAEVDGIPNVSHDDIINNPEIDVLIVCTPNFLNKQLTIRGLNAGKHVFCEKPPAFTAADIIEIQEAEQKSGKTLMYGFNHRHHDSVLHMKRLIDSGEYGKVLWLRGRYGKSVTKDYFNQWRAKKELAGGGILMDQGIHMLDLFLFLSGDFDVVKAEVTNLYWKMDVEDNAFVILKESSTGKVASLHSTMSQWRHLFSLEIFLEKGYMVLNGIITSTMSYGEETLSVARNRSTAPAATWKDEVVTKYVNNNSWRYEMDHFFDSIANNEPIIYGSSTDALKLMTVIDKIYEQKDF